MTETPDRPPLTLEELDEKIKRGRAAAGLLKEPEQPRTPGAGEGLRVAIEFVVSTCVGTGLGYAVGTFAGAKLIGLGLGMVIGVVAGFRTIFRTMTKTPEATDRRGKTTDGPEPD